MNVVVSASHLPQKKERKRNAGYIIPTMKCYPGNG